MRRERAEGRRSGRSVSLRVLALIASCAAPLAGQGAAALDGAVFLVTGRAEITAPALGPDRTRTVERTLRLRFRRAGDTLIVTADSAVVAETLDDRLRRPSTDGFVGGSWALLPSAGGGWTVVDRPFVPAFLTEISDLARTLDDFFPPTPPATLAVGGAATDSAGIRWRRLADSAGARRARWVMDATVERNERIRDTMLVRVATTTHEEGSVAWVPRSGAEAWQRRIDAKVRTALRGNDLQVVVRETTVVRRLR